MDATQTMGQTVDVVVIGAGPAGSVAAALARRRGLSVRILEKTQFPRFQIGESLLPQCMTVLEQAGMVEAVDRAGFQRKNGAQIVRGEQQVDFEFSAKTSAGYNYTYDVTRADFDHLLALEAEKQGAELYFRHEIITVDFGADSVQLVSRDAAGEEHHHRARFVLDASGFGRVLPRLLNLEKPADFPVRGALFTHVEAQINDAGFDCHKVRVAIHPQHDDVWYWLIPLAHGRASIGVVAKDSYLQLDGADPDERLWALIKQEPGMARMLCNAHQLWPAGSVRGYARSVTRLCGDHFALLGNAGEFLDPLFSSGVTLAMNSAALAVDALTRELAGESVDWEESFVEPLMLGVNTFRGYVEAWYEGDLQHIMLNPTRHDRTYSMMCGVLAGYAWDRSNPFVGNSRRRLRVLAQTIRSHASTASDLR